MRLWHSKLIPLLDGKRLCDLHMSCCNLRGMGWGKRNASINYLYDDPLGEEALAVYHYLVLSEMSSRGFKYDRSWLSLDYCGKRRPARQVDHEKYEEARRRNVPLKGHTVELYLNDVKALQRRGHGVRLFKAVVEGQVIYAAFLGNKKTIYKGD